MCLPSTELPHMAVCGENPRERGPVVKNVSGPSTQSIVLNFPDTPLVECKMGSKNSQSANSKLRKMRRDSTPECLDLEADRSKGIRESPEEKDDSPVCMEDKDYKARGNKWLCALTTANYFFQPCPVCSSQHGGRDSLLTYFDLDDPESMGMCSFCKDSRPGHNLIQIRRSTYHEVVKVSEIAKLADISGVQTYVINASKVVFLQPRPQPRPPKGQTMPATCKVDGRQLMDHGSLYCSLGCKLLAEGILPRSSPPPATPPAPPSPPTPKKRLRPVENLLDTLHWGGVKKRTGSRSKEVVVEGVRPSRSDIEGSDTSCFAPTPEIRGRRLEGALGNGVFDRGSTPEVDSLVAPRKRSRKSLHPMRSPPS